MLIEPQKGLGTKHSVAPCTAMPLYFFDLHVGSETDLDEIGIELANLDAARLAAIGGLLDAGKDMFTEVPAELSMSVRDGAGDVHALLHVYVWELTEAHE